MVRCSGLEACGLGLEACGLGLEACGLGFDGACARRSESEATRNAAAEERRAREKIGDGIGFGDGLRFSDK